MIEELKKYFIDAMRMLYPNGVSDPNQFRGIIRIYVFGFIDRMAYTVNDSGLLSSVRSVGQRITPWLVEEQKRLMCEVGIMVDANWWPDESWKWW